MADVVGCAREVQDVVALLHHLIDSGAMLLRLGVAITGAVDELVDDVVKPEEVGVGLVAGEVVTGKRKFHYRFICNKNFTETHSTRSRISR